MASQGENTRRGLQAPRALEPVVEPPQPEEISVGAVVHTLHTLMERVTSKEVNWQNVNAACNCAAQIVGLLRVHVECERLSIKMGRVANRTK